MVPTGASVGQRYSRGVGTVVSSEEVVTAMSLLLCTPTARQNSRLEFQVGPFFAAALKSTAGTNHPSQEFAYSELAKARVLRLARHTADRACSLTLVNAGTRIPTSKATMAMTTRSSISENPERLCIDPTPVQYFNITII